MLSLKHRSEEKEIMDDFSREGEVVHQTLRELHAINTYLGGNQLSIHALRELHKRHALSDYSIADLGCGGGDMLRLFDQWSRKQNLALKLTGIDANYHICEYARTNCREIHSVDIQPFDIFSEAFASQTFDIVHCSLFLHHFTDDEIIRLFTQLKSQARLAIVINDLHRHAVSYYFTKYLITRWSRSEMVRYDSVVSVARSFKRHELVSYLQAAGMKDYSLRWRWAYRWELVISMTDQRLFT